MKKEIKVYQGKTVSDDWTSWTNWKEIDPSSVTGNYEIIEDEMFVEIIQKRWYRPSYPIFVSEKYISFKEVLTGSCQGSVI